MSPKHYAVKSIFGPTIQGEGSMTGRVTLFLRFAGCNMWDGRPETRASSKCPFCDTDFFGGEKLDAMAILDQLTALAPPPVWVTISGGEPLLQLDTSLARFLKGAGFRLAVETNGTVEPGDALRNLLDQITCSPKVPREAIELTECDDLKVLYPHPNPSITPEAFADFPARARFLQPVNGINAVDNRSVAACLEKLYQLTNMAEDWSLSLQLHKELGLE